MSKLKNPIIPGYYPDPSICRVGEDFYLACSSFELYPGIPLFHSRDLVHWEQICNIMTADNDFHVEKNYGANGVMAPTIRFCNGVFYVINANFSDRGNYIVTATDPAGPWSAPHYLDDVPGIDASLFFDEDGECYVIGTGDVWDNGTGVKERGIWLARYDIEHFRMVGEPFTIWNSALRGASSPESPHIYHIGSYYYLVIAEGGTEHYHSVAVARSRELFSFYEGNPANPVLTHRHMGFHAPILNVGHADLIDLPDGSWYAVMLASRLIDGACKNLGRETFICPVIWEKDWPVFTPRTGKLEWEYDAPASLPETPYPEEPVRDEFDTPQLPLYWTFWGRPYDPYYECGNGALSIRCIPQRLDDELQPVRFEGGRDCSAYAAFIARRQRQPIAEAETCMHFVPAGTEEAGLAVVQAFNHQLRVCRCEAEGEQKLRVLLLTADFESYPYLPGFHSETKRSVLAELPWDDSDAVLRITMDGEDFRVLCGKSGGELKEICAVDGRLLNPEKVGCMTGTMIGMYATGNGTDSDNRAAFSYFAHAQRDAGPGC